MYAVPNDPPKRDPGTMVPYLRPRTELPPAQFKRGGVIGFGSILVGSHLGENFSATACPQDKRYDQRQRGNGKKYGRNR